MEANFKIVVALDDSGDKTESLWAIKVGTNYKIANVPFFAYGLSLGDVVRVDEINNENLYKEKIIESGHSTYRIFINNKKIEEFDFFWNILQSLGCTYEKGTENLYSIDVPASSDIYKVYEVLELGEKKEVWEFEEGHCGHPSVTELTT